MLKSSLLAFTRIQYDYIIRIGCQEKELYVEDQKLHKHDHFFCMLKFLYHIPKVLCMHTTTITESTGNGTAATQVLNAQIQMVVQTQNFLAMIAHNDHVVFRSGIVL